MRPDRHSGFSGFYRTHKDACLRAFVASAPNAESPADLVAEAFARALQRWDSVQHHPAPQAWVLRTALNLHRDEWRRRTSRSLRLAAATPVDDLHDPPTGSIDPDLMRAIGDLPERQRQTLVLRVLLCLSTRETAAELGIDPATVPVHLRRALATLRTSEPIKEYFDEQV